MTSSKEAVEEAARRYVRENFQPDGLDAFITGAEWQRAQVEELIQAARSVTQYNRSKSIAQDAYYCWECKSDWTDERASHKKSCHIATLATALRALEGGI